MMELSAMIFAGLVARRMMFEAARGMEARATDSLWLS